MSLQSPAAWTAEAASLPIAFAQVREDPALDFWVLDQIGPGARVIMIASGGCTAAALAARGDVSALDCVDPNPAQIAISRLKVKLLETDTPQRLKLLGHVDMEQRERAERLSEIMLELGLPLEVFGPANRTAAYGPDHAGRYEALFGALRAELAPVVEPLQSLLQLRNTFEQGRRVDPDTEVGQALDRAFGKVMCHANLVALFGNEATRNPRQPFANHFLSRLRSVLKTQPAAGNPFLGQMLLGRFAPGCEYVWLHAAAQKPKAAVTWHTSPLAVALKGQREAFDMAHLSNILDWLSPDEAAEQLELALAALRPRGWIIVRQLNSSLDIPALGTGFTWHAAQGEALRERDRSFFYGSILVGQRR